MADEWFRRSQVALPRPLPIGLVGQLEPIGRKLPSLVVYRSTNRLNGSSRLIAGIIGLLIYIISSLIALINRLMSLVNRLIPLID